MVGNAPPTFVTLFSISIPPLSTYPFPTVWSFLIPSYEPSSYPYIRTPPSSSFTSRHVVLFVTSFSANGDRYRSRSDFRRRGSCDMCVKNTGLRSGSSASGGRDKSVCDRQSCGWHSDLSTPTWKKDQREIRKIVRHSVINHWRASSCRTMCL